MMNPKAWETINGFTANAKAATERLGKLGVYFPENKQQLADAAARIEAECDATMQSLLTEALTGVDAKIAGMRAEIVPKRNRSPSITVMEAAGKRIQELTVDGGDDPDLNSFGVNLFFDDDTRIFLDLRAVLSCGVIYERGDGETVKEYPHRLLAHK
jgi:hypothetical protein